jgi:hypothetical protein
VQTERDHFAKFFEVSEETKNGGYPPSYEGDRNQAYELLKTLAEYGMFIVPVGELESWLSFLALLNGNAPCLEFLFDQIGESETDQNYLKPQSR